MRINNNLMALNTYNKMGSTAASQAKSMEKLSSGMRINRAGDDAAGLAISEKMRGQIRGLGQASRNAQDGISMIQTAEGALSETHSILQRMRELSVQASNDTMETSDRTAIGEELKELAKEVDRIADNTEFNGQKLLDGSMVTSQNTGGGNDLVVGQALNTTANATVSNIDVSGAKAGEDFTLSAGGAANELVLTRASDSVSQTVTIDATIGADGTANINFDQLGISIDIVGASAKTAADLRTDLVVAGNAEIHTAAGSGSADFAIGANAGQNVTVSFGDMRAAQLGDGSDLDTLVKGVAANAIVDTTAKAQTLITEVDGAIKDVATQRSKFGAAQNRLEHTINNLNTSAENLTAAESRVRDVDMAAEMMTFTKNNILQQAAQSMLAQANQAPQGVLQLLR